MFMSTQSEKQRAHNAKTQEIRKFLSSKITSLLSAFFAFIGLARVQTAVLQESPPNPEGAFRLAYQELLEVSAQNPLSQACAQHWDSIGLTGVPARTINTLLAVSLSYLRGGVVIAPRSAVRQFSSISDWRQHVTPKFDSFLQALLIFIQSSFVGAFAGGNIALLDSTVQESLANLFALTAELDARVPSTNNGLGGRALSPVTVKLIRDVSRQLSRFFLPADHRDDNLTTMNLSDAGAIRAFETSSQEQLDEPPQRQAYSPKVLIPSFDLDWSSSDEQYTTSSAGVNTIVVPDDAVSTAPVVHPPAQVSPL
jgi:hypothetical protein